MSYHTIENVQKSLEDNSLSKLPKLIILSGQGIPAITAANLYFNKLSSCFEIYLIEEKTITLTKVFKFFKKRITNKGFRSAMDILALRLFHIIWKHSPSVSKQYEPVFQINDINNCKITDFILEIKPQIIITNACSILKKETLKKINCPIINVHNGITPRYRGTGNFWAFFENNPNLVGTTIHFIDEGIDTGKQIAVEFLDVKKLNLAFQDIDSASFAQGAQMVIDYLLEKKQSIPQIVSKLMDCYYSYPGLSEYFQAQNHYYSYLDKKQKNEEIWFNSFELIAKDSKKSKFQRMHWHDDSTVIPRDEQIKKIFDEKTEPAWHVLDVGCGDGRYEDYLGCENYTGCDYSPSILNLGDKTNLIQCSADDLPFQDNSFDCCLAIGLFQHLENTQMVVDELRRVCKPGGLIIINTLRQFSLVELLLIALGYCWSFERLQLIWYIFKKNYFNGKVINGTLLARRYVLNDLVQMFKAKKGTYKTYYNGLFCTQFFSRELTLAIINTNKAKTILDKEFEVCTS